MARLIVGCGYLGLRVAQAWRAAGHRVWVTTRSAERAREFEQLGYQPLVLDVLQPNWPPLPNVTSVLWAVGHDRRSGQPIEQVYVDGLAHLLDQLADNAQKLIYVSSTGVYGDFGGDWVTEQSTCQPERAGGRACLAGEQLLEQSRFAARTIVLRMAGIYGPDRLPYLPALVEGRPLDAPAAGYLNLIHVEDAAQVVIAADEHGNPPRTYLVSDGQPVERAAFYLELARLLEAPAPLFCSTADAPASHRAAANKRISNARLMAELAPKLKYPSFREGLAAIAAEYRRQRS